MNWAGILFVSATATAASLGAWAFMGPYVRAWLWLPRESRDERRDRRFREYLERANTLDGRKYHYDATFWARRALLLEPGDPEALFVMGRIQCSRRRWELGLQFYKRVLETTWTEHYEPGTERSGLIAELSLSAARACAELWHHARTPEQRKTAEAKLREWGQRGIQDDVQLLECLRGDPLIRDIETHAGPLFAATKPDASRAPRGGT